MTCDAYRADLTAHIYGDLAPAEAAALEEHLQGCAACREELRALKRIALDLGDELSFPGESEVDWGAFASSTVQRALGFRPGKRAAAAGLGWREWLGQIRLAPGWAAAAAGLFLVAGAALGTFGALSLLDGSGEVPAPIVMMAPAPVEMVTALLPQRMLDDIEAHSAKAGTRRYIQESRALVLSLLSSPLRCTQGDVDIKAERAKSLELIRRQRLIADDLERLPLARAQDVCRDLERLLLEIASLSDCARVEQILELRELVDRHQLLLRMDLLSDEMARSAPVDA